MYKDKKRVAIVCKSMAVKICVSLETDDNGLPANSPGVITIRVGSSFTYKNYVSL
jgi:hypothetical protein